MFHLGYFRRILGNRWQDKARNNDVLSGAGIPFMFTLLRQRPLRSFPFCNGRRHFKRSMPSLVAKLLGMESDISALDNLLDEIRLREDDC